MEGESVVPAEKKKFNLCVNDYEFFPKYGGNHSLPVQDRYSVVIATVLYGEARRLRGKAKDDQAFERLLFENFVKEVRNLTIDGVEIKTGRELFDNPKVPLKLMEEIAASILMDSGLREHEEKN